MCRVVVRDLRDHNVSPRDKSEDGDHAYDRQWFDVPMHSSPVAAATCAVESN